jgi:hypothetical protein
MFFDMPFLQLRFVCSSHPGLNVIFVKRADLKLGFLLQEMGF